MIAIWAVVLIAWAALLVGFLMGAWWASIPRDDRVEADSGGEAA